jgi:hypothetical protein
MLNSLRLTISPAIRFSTLVARMFLVDKFSLVRFKMKCASGSHLNGSSVPRAKPNFIIARDSCLQVPWTLLIADVTRMGLRYAVWGTSMQPES